MPRKKKNNSTILVAVSDKPKEVVFPIVNFDNREFEIHPISDRNDDFAYDDSAEFITLAIPVGSKVFNEMLKLGAENKEAVDRVARAQKDGDDIASVVVDLVGMLSKADFGDMLKEVADTLPRLAAIACHYSDLDVTESDVKRWSKSPMNQELWKAVIAQMKADNIIAQIGALQGLLGEFTSA